MDTVCLPLNDDSLRLAVDLLRAGEVVAFPTETVYGLGADAGQPDAVKRIFEVKGRPADHPVIVHLADGDDPLRWAAEWSPLAQELTAAFWPGPLTLIVPRREGVSDSVTGGQSTVGLRCPSHPGAQALLSAFGGGVAAPSANRFGRISPTTAAHVMEELGGRIPLILDGGEATVGIESTIIDVSRGYPVLLRPGDLNAVDVERVVGHRLARPDAQAPRVSGSLESHYAPQRRLQLVASQAMPDLLSTLPLTGAQPVAVIAWSEAVLAAAASCGLGFAGTDVLTDASFINGAQAPASRAVLAGSKDSVSPLTAAGVCIALPSDVHGIAHYLYAALRWADHQSVKTILCEQPPAQTAWEGVADRLRRASAGHA